MKTLNKKILTSCIALMMAVAMAVPVFADEHAFGSFLLKPLKFSEGDTATTPYALNVVGNHEVSENRDVNIYSMTGDQDQVWVYDQCTDGKRRMMSALASQAYALNVYYPASGAMDLRCDIMQWLTNLNDSALWYGTDITPLHIELSNYDYQLAVKDVYNGAPAIWHKNNSSSYEYAQVWVN